MRFLRNKSAVVWFAGLVAASCVWALAILTTNGFSTLNTLVFDTYQRQKPRVWADTPVAIVDLDEQSIQRVGQWPWPRTVMAKLTDKLGDLGASTIVFDMVFSEPDRTSPIRVLDDLRKAGASVQLPNKVQMLDNDSLLAEAIARNRVVTGLILSKKAQTDPPSPKAGTGFVGSRPLDFSTDGWKAIRNLPAIDEAATGIGNFALNFEAQRDAVIRKVQLITGANGNDYPSLAMEALRVAQGAGGFKLKSSDGSGEIAAGNLNIVSAQVGALEIPTDADGTINIYHSKLEGKPVLSALSVLFPLEGDVDQNQLAETIQDRIVLIGTSAAGLKDLRATQLQTNVPGVTIHADIIDQILSGTFLKRPDIAPGIEWFMSIVIVLTLLFFLPRLNAIAITNIAGFLTISIIGLCWYAFSAEQLLFSPVLPVFSILAAFAAGLAADLLITEREGRFIKGAFSYYLSPTMVKQLADNPQSLTLGGEEKELTILFCDIRGFTSISEGLNPTELTELLNGFLTPMTTVLLNNGATIDKYMGDAIMAFWNAPLHQEDHHQLACKSLIDMRAALKKLNAGSKHPIQVGIGINTGACCVGNLGSSQRFSYSAIGDSVNVASRIEGLTKLYGLDNLAAEETLNHVTGFSALEVDRVSVVGRDQPLTVFTLLGHTPGLSNETFTRLNDAHDRMLDAYRAGDAETGLIAMTEASRISQKFEGPSLLRLYAVYAERFATFREHGVPEKWDGVYRPESK